MIKWLVHKWKKYVRDRKFRKFLRSCWDQAAREQGLLSMMNWLRRLFRGLRWRRRRGTQSSERFVVIPTDKGDKILTLPPERGRCPSCGQWADGTYFEDEFIVWNKTFDVPSKEIG